MEALILAGGAGTRLRTVLPHLPKPMAPIGDKPFLEYLIRKLVSSDVERIILLTGYMHESIEAYFGHHYQDVDILYSREQTPLGTGGAIKLAMELTMSKSVLVLNGDTFFNLEYKTLISNHDDSSAQITIALKPMSNCTRYGTIRIDQDKITDFIEKGHVDRGVINGGVYVCRKTIFDDLDLPKRFSFEEDFLQPYSKKMEFRAFVSDDYFVDIGIPEDYNRAQEELRTIV